MSRDTFICDVKISGVSAPTTVTQGKAFSIKGTITANYTNLTSVSGYIYREGDYSSSVYEKTDTTSGNFYDLLNSAIDKALLFNKLSSGNYTYWIKAKAQNNFSNDGKTMGTVTHDSILVIQPFTVTGSTSCAHTYKYAVTTKPTVSAAGTLTGTCSKCSKKTTVPLPKLSAADYTYAVTTAPTCTAAGSARYTWRITTYGTYSFDVSVAALGHSYADGVCARCGQADPNSIPRVTEQPASATVVFGASTTMKVAAEGPNLTYQWQYKYANSSTWKDWSGRTAASLTLTGNSTNHLCQYRCLVKNAAGSVYSNAATLTVTPKITTQPKNATVGMGTNTTFTVAASGTGLSYQWQYQYANTTAWKTWSGKTAATLTVTGKESNNGCSYRCIVKNSGGSVTSSAAKLTVTSTVPVIMTNPSNQSTTIGGTVTMKAAASGTGLSYQWQYSHDNGASWKNWSGKTSASLSITGKASNNGCLYRCVVSNSYGSVNSSAARLTVTDAAPVILTKPTNLSTKVGGTVTMKVTAGGSGLSYQWQYSHNNGASWKNWSGKTSASLSITGKASNNGCLYRCVVKNSYGTVTSSSAQLTVTDAAPVILTNPSNATVAVGKTVTMKVVAGGSGLSYQWQYKYPNGSWKDWSGKTSASLTITGKTTNGGCQYRCIVKNSHGSVTSSAATLTVK